MIMKKKLDILTIGKTSIVCCPPLVPENEKRISERSKYYFDSLHIAFIINSYYFLF